MDQARIILLLELSIKILKLLDDLFLLIILFLQRNNVFEHVEWFYFERFFVFEALIDGIWLFRSGFDLLVTIASFFILIDGFADTVRSGYFFNFIVDA